MKDALGRMNVTEYPYVLLYIAVVVVGAASTRIEPLFFCYSYVCKGAENIFSVARQYLRYWTSPQDTMAFSRNNDGCTQCWACTIHLS